jgi:alkylhydroperoxidase family enzyme
MTAPRLPIRRDVDDPRFAELFAKGLRGPDGAVLNIFGALANHPDLLRRWLVFATHVLSKSTLSARDRELLVLRTGWNCASVYEWGQHVLIARQCGLDDGEIERVKLGPDADGWTPADAALLRAADELHVDAAIGDDTWASLSTRFTAEQLLDVVATVGNYHLVAMILNTLRVPLDPGVPDASGELRRS